MCIMQVPHWSSLGRLKRLKFPSLGGGGGSFGGGAGPGAMSVVAGRLICDTYLSARELVKEVDYTLTTLSLSLLKQERADLAPSDVPGGELSIGRAATGAACSLQDEVSHHAYLIHAHVAAVLDCVNVTIMKTRRTMLNFRSVHHSCAVKFESAAGLLTLVKLAESDAWLALGLMFYLSVLPLTRQLAQLSGSLWGKALMGQRAARIEMLLLHEFHAHKFLLADKLTVRVRGSEDWFHRRC